MGTTVAAVMTVIAAGLGWFAWRTTRPVEHALVQLSAELGSDAGLSLPNGGSIALSADGKTLAAIVRGADGQRRLATRRLDQRQLTPLPRTEGASGPFFSPDGRWIAFFTPSGQLRKISIEGGTPVTICDPCRVTGSWGDDGNIVVASGVASGLTLVPAGGGVPTPLTHINISRHELGHRWPQMLPGSQGVLFTVYSNTSDYDDSDIDVVSVKSGERKTVYHGGFFARYLPTGHLVFIHQNTLFAAPFDLKKLALKAPPQPAIEEIRNQFDEGGNFDFSQTGTAVYLSRGDQLQRSIFWMDRAGRTQPLQLTPGLYASPRFSPDGKRLAFSLDDGQGHTDIWVRELESDRTTRLTSIPGRNDFPTWTPDGGGIVFVAFGPTAPSVYWMRSDGAGPANESRTSRPGGSPSPSLRMGRPL